MTNLIFSAFFFGAGSILLFGINHFWLHKSLRETGVPTLLVYFATILNWIGLAIVVAVRLDVGCSALSGECYAEGYYPDYDTLYALVTVSTLATNTVSCLFVIVDLVNIFRSRSSATSDQNVDSSNNAERVLRLPRKGFSEKESINYTIVQNDDGKPLMSMSQDDLEILKTNLKGQHSPEQMSSHFKEMQRLLDQQDTLNDQISENTDNLEIFETKLSELSSQVSRLKLRMALNDLLTEYVGMSDRYTVLIGLPNSDIKASGRRVAILRSQVHLLEVMKVFTDQLCDTSLWSTFDDWWKGAATLRNQYYDLFNKHLDRWELEKSFEVEWIKYVAEKEED